MRQQFITLVVKKWSSTLHDLELRKDLAFEKLNGVSRIELKFNQSGYYEKL